MPALVLAVNVVLNLRQFNGPVPFRRATSLETGCMHAFFYCEGEKEGDAPNENFTDRDFRYKIRRSLLSYLQIH